MIGGARQSPRLFPLTGAFNFRDLGGYPGRDGRATRWGTALPERHAPRAERPRTWTCSSSLGLTTIIDLRTPRELERTGRGPLGDHPIGFHHLSVIQDEEPERPWPRRLRLARS